MAGRLEDKAALITGTGSGQGRAAALRFTAEGAHVVGCDVDADGNAETIALVKAAGGEMIGMAPVDLGDSAQATAWVKEAAAVHGRIDILYNNASAARWGMVADLSDEDWHFTIRNELDLIFFVTRAAWPYLAERGGVIINTASVAGHGGGPGGLAHATTKAGVLAMTRTMAAEGGPVGVRAVSISPGPIETPGAAAQLSDPDIRGALLARMPIKRLGQPEDVVGLATFLASDDASFITGTEVLVDGGMTMA